jgi:hypothetical protein
MTVRIVPLPLSISNAYLLLGDRPGVRPPPSRQAVGVIPASRRGVTVDSVQS